MNLADDTLAWTLGPDGVWTQITGGGTVDTHERLEAIAAGRVRQPPADPNGWGAVHLSFTWASLGRHPPSLR